MAHTRSRDLATRERSRAFALFVTCLMAVVLCCLAPFWAGKAYAAAEPFDYDGDEITFISAEGKEFGMYSRQDGSSLEYQNGAIAVEHITHNTTIYAGFYLEADKDDPATWTNFYPRNSEGWLSFTLDPSYAGKAWPIAPVKVSDMTATTSGQYYLAVPPLEKIPGYLLKVVFTDGMGNDISEQMVVSGEDAVPPPDPKSEGHIFLGWDFPYTNITQDTFINALWAEDEATYFTVTFEDGWGSVVKTQYVKEGEAAIPPSDPTHDGYTFAGWEPGVFDNISEDTTIVATWTNDGETALQAARDAIAALPNTPKSVLRDTYNELVAAASTAYDALSDDLKAQLTDDERLRLTKFAIAILPSDPYEVTTEYRPYIDFAQSLFESLSAGQQAELDSTDGSKTISSGRSYGRYLENAVWALDSLRTINNVTTLKAGTYTGQVESSSSMGKSSSRRALSFTVKSVTVKDGRATAILEHSTEMSESLKIGGVVYESLQTDQTKHSYYEIPINLNSTFHFAVMGKNATDNTDAITYEMAVAADTSTMKPDSKSSGSGSSESSGSGSGSGSGSSSGSGSASKSGSGSSSRSGSSSGSKSSSTSTSSKTTSGSKLTATGATAASTSSGAKLTATGSTSRAAGAATSRSGGTASSENSKSSASKASADKSSTKTNSSTKEASTTSGAGSAPDGAAISEVGFANPGSSGAMGAGNVDLRPAVAGGCLLFVSVGLLGFVLRFVRRESILG